MPIELYSIDESGQLQADEKNRIAKGIKRARKNAGYTQQTLADALNLHIKSVMNWEQGRSIPEWKDVFRLCNLFQCDVDYLFGRIDGRNHDLDFLQSVTGLTEDAIFKLNRIKDHNDRDGASDILSTLIEDPNCEYFLALFGSMISSRMNPAPGMIETEINGSRMTLYNSTMIEAILQTKLIENFKQIADLYASKHKQTPDEKRTEYDSTHK